MRPSIFYLKGLLFIDLFCFLKSDFFLLLSQVSFFRLLDRSTGGKYSIHVEELATLDIYLSGSCSTLFLVSHLNE